MSIPANHLFRFDAKAGTFVNKGLGTKCGRGWVGIRGNCRRSTGKKRNKQGEIIPEKNPSSRTKEEAMGKKGLTVAQKAKAIVMAAKVREDRQPSKKTKYQSALHEAFSELVGRNVKQLPRIVVTPAANPFLPSSEKYEGTDITPDQVMRASAKYAKKYHVKVNENSPEFKAAIAKNMKKYGNEFGYLD